MVPQVFNFDPYPYDCRSYNLRGCFSTSETTPPQRRDFQHLVSQLVIQRFAKWNPSPFLISKSSCLSSIWKWRGLAAKYEKWCKLICLPSFCSIGALFVPFKRWLHLQHHCSVFHGEPAQPFVAKHLSRHLSAFNSFNKNGPCFPTWCNVLKWHHNIYDTYMYIYYIYMLYMYMYIYIYDI